MSAPEAWHVTRTLRAMELLAVRPRSAPELADALGVHVRTARRVLKRLHGEGYVMVTDDRRRRYRPTMRVVALAGQVVERAELPAIALPHVSALREQLGEGCHLCVPSHLFALCLVHDAPEAGCACRPHLRELVPCHCTAAGKALLAWRERWREAVLTQRLEASSPAAPLSATARQDGRRGRRAWSHRGRAGLDGPGHRRRRPAGRRRAARPAGRGRRSASCRARGVWGGRR